MQDKTGDEKDRLIVVIDDEDGGEGRHRGEF